MKTKNTSMTIIIDDTLKRKAKLNALINNMTLREYIAYLIEEDCRKNSMNEKYDK